jgi:hypothetical protein
VLVERDNSQALNDTVETIPFAGGNPTVLAQGDAPTWNR